jgi:hypothetical protein
VDLISQIGPPVEHPDKLRMLFFPLITDKDDKTFPFHKDWFDPLAENKWYVLICTIVHPYTAD